MADAGRCPGVVETVTSDEHQKAVDMAGTVVVWAEGLVAVDKA
ncbi:MAG: hypothetical protein V3W34_10145 [Phycisphaerae bacterium]